MARKSEPLQCSQDNIEELQALTQDSSQPRIAERATLVLEFVKGSTITEIAQRYSVQANTVIKWKRRYAEQGIEGLLSLPRGNTKDVYGKDFKKRLVALVHSAPPNGAPYWTAPMLADELNVPLYAVHVYLRKSKIRLLELRSTSKAKTCEARANDQNVRGIVEVNDEIEDDDEIDELGVGKGEDNGIKLDIEVMLLARDASGNVVFKTEMGRHGLLAAENRFDGKDLPRFLRDMGISEKELYATILEASEQFVQRYKEYSISYKC